MKQMKAASVSHCGAPLLAASSVLAMACALLLATFCAISTPTFAEEGSKTSKQIGRFIQVGLPITDQTVQHVRRVVGRARVHLQPLEDGSF